MHALLGPRLHQPRAILEIHNRHVLRRHAQVPEQNRQGALGHRAKTDAQDSLTKLLTFAISSHEAKIEWAIVGKDSLRVQLANPRKTRAA